MRTAAQDDGDHFRSLLRHDEIPYAMESQRLMGQSLIIAALKISCLAKRRGSAASV